MGKYSTIINNTSNHNSLKFLSWLDDKYSYISNSYMTNVYSILNKRYRFLIDSNGQFIYTDSGEQIIIEI